jgi:hypothetical protein
LRYLAPPTALAVNALSIILGLTLSPLFFIPVATYLALILIGSIVLGKSIAEKIVLPTVLVTMHMVWGAGYLSSPKKLMAEDE